MHQKLTISLSYCENGTIKCDKKYCQKKMSNEKKKMIMNETTVSGYHCCNEIKTKRKMNECSVEDMLAILKTGSVNKANERGDTVLKKNCKKQN